MTPYYQDEAVTLYHGDCREVLPSVSAGVIVTDPPYGTGGWRRGESGAGDDPSGKLVVESWDDGAVDWLRLTSLPVVSFWPQGSAFRFLSVAAETGRTKHRALYMRKLDPKPQVGGRVRWSMEPIWVVSRDGFVLYGGDDVVDASTPRAGRDAEATGHPYQKPEAVMVWLIAKLPEAPICDPFAGSGTTLVAAKRLGVKAVGCEINEAYCAMAAKRLSQGALPLEFSA